MSSSVAEAAAKERLHSSGEDYLKAIFILEAQHGSVRSVEVAEYMNVSKASVSHAVALLKKNGFLKMNQNYDFVLTDSGRAIASCIYEKHCYFKDISCKEIAMQALKTACTFYGGDWAGTLEVDLDFDV